MRILSGILLVWAAVLRLVAYFYSKPSEMGTFILGNLHVDLDKTLSTLLIVGSGLALAGAVLIIMRRLWGFCLAVSILFYWSIIPLIYVCIKKKDWKS